MVPLAEDSLPRSAAVALFGPTGGVPFHSLFLGQCPVAYPEAAKKHRALLLLLFQLAPFH